MQNNTNSAYNIQLSSLYANNLSPQQSNFSGQTVELEYSDQTRSRSFSPTGQNSFQARSHTSLSMRGLTLHDAINMRDLNQIQKLIESRKNINEMNKHGETPLHLACKDGLTEIVKLLLNYLPLVDAKNKKNQTPLHLAAINGHTEVVELLLSYYKIEIDAQDCDYETPLHFAAKKGHLAVVELLVNHGADINKITDQGKTAFFFAKFYWHEEVVKFLNRHGANNTSMYDLIKYNHEHEISPEDFYASFFPHGRSNHIRSCDLPDIYNKRYH